MSAYGGATAEAVTAQRIQVHGPDEPVDAARWDAYVADSASASLYHRHAFRELVTEVFGHPSYYLSAWAQSELVGVLPLVRLRSRLFGDFMVSMPFFNYGGALAENEDIEEALMQRAGQLAGELGVSHIEFRDDRARADHWPVKTHKVAMKLALPDSEEALWKAIGSKLRAQVRRPLKEQANAVTGGIELLPEFYRVFARNMRDLGTPVYSVGLFERLLTLLPDAARIVLVRVAGRPAAAGLLLRHRETMEIPWASSVREYNRLGVNMLLYWEALRHSLFEGCRTFDFGRSTADSGTYKFKRQWGAQPQPLYWHYWLNKGRELPALNPDNPKYDLAVRAWRRLPLWVANIIGPRLVRNLP